MRDAPLGESERAALRALGEEGAGILPEDADLDRLERLGLVRRVGITVGLTERGRRLLEAPQAEAQSLARST